MGSRYTMGRLTTLLEAENHLFVQANQDRRLFTRLLFSYRFNARTVLFRGYTDKFRWSKDFAITRSDRAFFVKLGYAWRI